MARYFGREWQSKLARKHIAFNGPPQPGFPGQYYDDHGKPEAEQLLENGFLILSAYQFYSDNPRKFLFGVDARIYSQ